MADELPVYHDFETPGSRITIGQWGSVSLEFEIPKEVEGVTAYVNPRKRQVVFRVRPMDNHVAFIRSLSAALAQLATVAEGQDAKERYDLWAQKYGRSV